MHTPKASSLRAHQARLQAGHEEAEALHLRREKLYAAALLRTVPKRVVSRGEIHAQAEHHKLREAFGLVGRLA